MSLIIDVNDPNRARYGLIETFTTEQTNPTLVLVPDGNNGVHFVSTNSIIPIKENQILVNHRSNVVYYFRWYN